VEFDSRKECTFLAATCWVAQYSILPKDFNRDFNRTRQILDALLAYAGDLGFFAKEANPSTGQMLGNFPQSFVQASFIGAAIDLREALKEGCGTD
jgi:GH15 family glucan-1,4-alpha-glucosidase